MVVSNTFIEDHSQKDLYMLGNANLYSLKNKSGYTINKCRCTKYAFRNYLKGVCVMGTYNEVKEYCRDGLKCTEVTPTWTKKTKVAFYGSSFPSLLLGRLNVDIKRTTNLDNADYLVVDSLNEYPSSSPIVLIGTDKNDNCVLYYFGWQEDQTVIPAGLQTYFPGYTFQWASSCSINRQVFMDVTKQHSNKCINTQTLVKHVYSSVTKPSDEEDVKSLISMLTSQDQDLGFNTLVYYNFFDYLPNIYQALLNKGVESSNSSAKFVYYILNTSSSQINDLRASSTTRRLNKLGALKQNSFMTNQALINLQKILNDQVGIEINSTFKDALDAINAHVVIVTNDA
jgi:hypothetical protein